MQPEPHQSDRWGSVVHVNLFLMWSKWWQRIFHFHYFITTNRLHVIASLTPFNHTLTADWLHLIAVLTHLVPSLKQRFPRQQIPSQLQAVAVIFDCFPLCDFSIISLEHFTDLNKLNKSHLKHWVGSKHKEERRRLAEAEIFFAGVHSAAELSWPDLSCWSISYLCDVCRQGQIKAMQEG